MGAFDSVFRAHCPFHEEEASGHLSTPNQEVTIVVITNCAFAHRLASPLDLELPGWQWPRLPGSHLPSLSYLWPTDMSALP